MFSLDSQSSDRRGGKPGVCWQLLRLPLNLQAVRVATCFFFQRSFITIHYKDGKSLNLRACD